MQSLRGIKAMDKLPKNQERIGSYATKKKAEYHAQKRTRETGIQHKTTKTVTYRDLMPFSCYTVYI